MKTLLCIGYGYVARHLAARMRPDGWRIIGTTRTPGRAATGADQIVIWPGTALPEASHVLISAPPDTHGCPAFGAVPGRPDWIGYLSATGVYGDQGGGWVHETTPRRPERATGRNRVRAEDQWHDSAHIFRLAGIYGPGRSVFDRMRNGTARRVIKPGQYFSRIHVDDIVQALRTSMAAPRPGSVWNLADDEPAPPQDLIAYAARLSGLPLPPEVPFETADLSPMARAFYSENKRVSNRAMKSDLGVALRYPTYREGLSAIWKAQSESPRPAP